MIQAWCEGFPRRWAHALAQHPGLFDLARPAALARAPGRLDVMGGIADYAGATVLERTCSEGTVCVAQVRGDDFVVVSAANDVNTPARAIRLARNELQRLCEDEVALNAFFKTPANHWAAYVLGAVIVLHKHQDVTLPPGLALLLVSDVPEGRGVSSSAAAEVASLYAVAQAVGVSLAPDRVAWLAQRMEHTLAGAPCGLMDQLAVVYGGVDQLLRIRCQPGSVQGVVTCPAQLRLWGIDSGVSHAVSGADYGTVRAATFMGYRILAHVLNMPIAHDAGQVQIDDQRFGGFLANVPPSELMPLLPLIPAVQTGAEFLRTYGGSSDTVTSVQPAIAYRVRDSLAHAVLDSHRALVFAALLDSPNAIGNAPHLGELMLQSHASYGVIGLGSEATDALIADVRAARARGVFGGRITGGGSGGTVCVLAHAEADVEVQAIAARHSQRMGKPCHVFSGTSPGAHAFGTHQVMWQGDRFA
ncbi:MAG: GHMP kinase [Deltaproteobacteria bacterium]|nr:GHMP kinase [Deltaproteobacteria bacterium]